MRRITGKGAVIAAAAVLAWGLNVTAEETATETVAEQEGYTLGTRADDADYMVELTNETGQSITSAAIRVDAGEYGEELVPEGSVFEDGQTAALFCTPKPLEAGAVSAPRYDIRLVFEDGEVAVIHTFPFGDADEVSVLLDDETEEETEAAEEETEEAAQEESDPLAQTVVAYLKFTSKSLGSEQNTCQHERDTLNPPAVDYSAYTDYSYSDYSYSDYSYSEPSYTDYSWSGDSGQSYDVPVYADGGNADDQCGADGILN